MKTYAILSLLISIATAQSCYHSGDNLINGRCFRFVGQKLSWQDARHYCGDLGLSLATVADSRTDNFLAAFATTAFNDNSGNFWIGASRNSQNRWQWDDGTPFVWSNFETQNQNFASESIKNGKWNTFVEETRLHFVCSYWPGATVPTVQYSPTPEVTTETTTAPVPESTVSDPSNFCTRRTNSTILIAYSNDVDDYDYNVLKNGIVFHNGNNFFYGYSTYANVRFDVEKGEDIQYHSDILSFNASMTARGPDPTIGYKNTTTGSDIFNVLQKFLNNKQSTVCGSLVYILVKRYPNNVDVSNLIAQLRENHVFVYIVVHNIPSGGVTTDPLFKIATATNGFCIFNSGANFWVSISNAIAVNYRPYQFLSQNFVVSGNGRIEMPVFETPSIRTWGEQVLVVITIQSHKLDASFKSLNYTIASVDGSFAFTGPDAENGWPRFGSAILAQPNLNGTVDYKWTIDYHFTNDQPQVIETRMHSNFYHDFLPLPAV